MLTQKGRYALRAVLYLAQKNSNQPVLISEIAEAESIPKKFLESILLEMKNHGVLSSKKGKGGGYLLQREPGDVVIGEIVELIDGPLQSGNSREGLSACAIELLVSKAQSAAADIFNTTTLQMLIEQAQELRAKSEGTIAFDI